MVSVVVEWDNARLSEAARSREMLTRLEAQARALPSPAEVVVCFNDEHIDGEQVRELLSKRLTVKWTLAPQKGCEYYELKNAGAGLSQGDPIVFVDSDVIPEPGWLAQLLSCFEDPAVQVACGSSFIDPAGLYAKAFGMFWFFPPRPEGREVRPAPYFFANNVAFRRAVFERFPFPRIERVSRGSCRALAEQLGAAGILIWRNTAAQVSHPPPNGLGHFAVRALAQGRDRLLDKRRPSGWQGTPLGSAARLAANLGRAARGIATEFRRAGVAPWELPVVAALAAAYYGLCFCGELATHMSPGWMSRHFRI
jgi:hypothetical protein